MQTVGGALTIARQTMREAAKVAPKAAGQLITADEDASESN